MKTARAVQPNLGRQAKFKNKLDTFLKPSEIGFSTRYFFICLMLED